MKKNPIKYIVNTMLFIDVCAIAAIGLLLAYAIPGERAAQASKYFLGLHRHDWGTIHLYLSIFLLVLLAIHIGLNWNWIAQSTRRYFGDRWKNVLWLVSGAWILVLAISWIMAKV